MRSVSIILITIGMLLASSHARSYRYDKVGRLVLAVYESGEALEYIYSHGNNIMAVNRIQLPPSPDGLNVERAFAQSAKLQWNDNSENETGFRLFRRLAASSAWLEIADIPANTTSFTDSNLEPDFNYVYRIVALSDNENGFHSAYSQEIAASGEGSIQFSLTGFRESETEESVFILSFEASTQATYRLQSSATLSSESWTEHAWSTSASGPFFLAEISGAETPQSIFVETTPNSATFFRLIVLEQN